MMSSVSNAQAEDFYEARLREGVEAYRLKRNPEAIDEFRVAAFGFLNSPALLSETLVRLSLAQSAAGKSSDADATLQRFLEVERQFSLYPKIHLEPGIRTEFQALLTRRVSVASIQSVPSLAGLIETEQQKVANLPSKARRKALEAGMRREPENAAWPLGLAEEAAERQDHKAVVEWAGKAIALSPDSAEALALRAHAKAQRGDCPGALADLRTLPLSETKARPELSADEFVCLVQTKDWAGAEAARKLVPAEMAARSDVARAQTELSRHPTAAVAASATARPPAPTPPPTREVERSPAASPPAPPTPAPSRQGAASAQSLPESSVDPVARPAAETLAESRRLVKAGRADEAEKLLGEALKREPENRDLRLAMLEASCLSGAWSRAAAQLPRVSPLGESEASSMFYAAVALYETGRQQEARDYLQRSLPRVSGPLVDQYAKKILGRP